MFHACGTRFNVTENFEKLFGFQSELNKSLVVVVPDDWMSAGPR